MISIPPNLKYFLIVVITFCIIYWFQTVDDKKRCKKRTSIYDKIKLPLLVSAIVGLIILWNNNFYTLTNYNKEISKNFFNDLNLQQDNNNEINTKPQNFFRNNKSSIISSKQTDIDVYPGLPDF